MRTQPIRSHRARRTVAWSLVVLASLVPAIVGAECAANDAQATQIRTDVAPAVASVFGSLGDLVGAYASSWIKPVPEPAAVEPSLK